MSEPHVKAVKVVLSDGGEITIDKSLFIEYAKHQYLKHLPENEVKKDEMYKMMGFVVCLLDSIKNFEIDE